MVPKPPTRPPYQCSADGWQGEFAGYHGAGIVRPDFTMVNIPAEEGYFDGPVDPPSSVQYQGQPYVGTYVSTTGG